MTMSATREIAEFVVSFPGDDVPAEEINCADRCWLDTIGVMLAGSVERHGQLVVRYVAQNGGAAQASIVGSALRVPATEAALANGNLAHALEYDDMGGYGHPSAPLIPALLALAEYGGVAHGGAVAIAHVIGYEVGLSLFRGGYANYDRAFHSTPVFGTMAATAAGSRLLGLSVDSTQNALAIAASGACGIGGNNGTMTKPLHAGIAARNAVQAVLLAKRGFSGAPDVLEQPNGFCETFLGIGRSGLDEALAGLGKPFKLARSVTVKKYPCCGGNHSALDGVLELMEREQLQYEDIEEVEVRGMSPASPVLRFRSPRTGLNGKFSIQHAVASAIVNGRVGIDEFTDEAVVSDRLSEARDRVRVDVMSRWDKRVTAGRLDGTPVRMTLRDSRTLENHAPRSSLRGTRAVPLSDTELAQKFRANAALALSEPEVDLVLRRWERLSASDDVCTIVSAIAH